MLIPTIWNGMGDAARRELELGALNMGNRIVWLRLVPNTVGSVRLDIVKVNGRSATGNTGLLSLEGDMQLILSRLDSWHLYVPADNPNFVANVTNFRTYRQLIPHDNDRSMLSLQQQQQLVMEMNITDEMKKLLAIDLTGFSAESRDSETTNDTPTDVVGDVAF